jgi:hypothetical protein
VTGDIAAFIRARLDERADALGKAINYQDNHGDVAGMDGGWELWGDFGRLVYQIVQFRHMLRAVDAKRRLLDKVANWEHQRLYDDTDENTGPYPCSRDGATCECGVLDQQIDVLHWSAVEWSTHPDYRQDWTP